MHHRTQVPFGHAQTYEDDPLFNKKKMAAAEAEQAHRAELDALQAQLDTVTSERAALEARIAALSQTSDRLDLRLAALDRGVQTVGQRLDHVESFSTELDAINTRLQSFEPSPPPPSPPSPPSPSPSPSPPPPPSPSPPPPPSPPSPSPPPPPPPLAEADTPEHHDDNGADLRHRLEDLAQQTSSLDARISSVSMELANQLTELSRDIDELNRRSEDPAGSGSTAEIDTAEIDTAEIEARIAQRLDVALEEVLDSTERLAAEQARYEIQFRADLAELAERLRRPGGA